ncbi:PREDICTED: wall-associated receptor kinase-like 1 [Prunus mume]|uniref:Wall-associated receptor kinase-like 1 n=1 Tax=Prunus mume TaxID=102107 RepID=A0ABM0NTS4_PRUMU|nr:PREDICTED: wall-associated receptor kinase-like 1 [Prunus mume]
MVGQLLLHITLFLWSMSNALLAVASEASLAKPNCLSQCGNITQIPYPFGIGAGCYLDDWFQIICDNSASPPKAFLNRTGLEVLEISLGGTLTVTSAITFSNCNNKKSDRQAPNVFGSPFVYSQSNRFTSIGCEVIALMSDFGKPLAGCYSICDNTAHSSSTIFPNNSCSGLHCCQTTILKGLSFFDTTFRAMLNDSESEKECKYAFLVDRDWFMSTNISTIVDMDNVPVVLEYQLRQYSAQDIYGTYNFSPQNMTCNNHWQCSCKTGYQGNPYLLDGCQDIDECLNSSSCRAGTCINRPGDFVCYQPDPRPIRRINVAVLVAGGVIGLLFLLIGAWWSHKVIKKRKDNKRKQKFFKQNGGLLLEKQLSSGEVNVEKIKLFSSKDLDKATDKFSIDRILGQGGQGTVYKGMLSDGRIVAVKKSKIVDGGEVGQFINEIVILSQIIHRNVVKILGCCLETEVPLLVYEFIPNGTLSQYIHHPDEEFSLTWEMRLRIAIEVAGALSYLHSAASFPIYHRDIKSSNILLDEKYRAKVADFGTSRSVSIDQTHLTTLVHGTFGYLDPEYFQSSQFTEKSDVYSFGVVLAELLTGQKPVSFMRSQESRSLATYFLLSMENNLLFDILDSQVMKDGRKEKITAVANLAVRCLNLNGRNRPTMKEVAVELEGIQLSVRAETYVQQVFPEVRCVQTKEINEVWDVVSSSTGACTDGGTGSSFDVQPLLFFNTQ